MPAVRVDETSFRDSIELPERVWLTRAIIWLGETGHPRGEVSEPIFDTIHASTDAE